MDSLSPEGAAPKLEERLGKEHKLETLGALAGFIAHDLNNELTVILGNVELSLDSLDRDDRLYEGLVEARNATHRCVEMTRALLNLGRSVKPELKPVELDTLLRGTERILRKVLPPALSTKFAKHTHLPVVMADANQIQQVIMNLAANASRAMCDESLLEVQAKNGPKYVTISISLSRIGPLLESPKRLYESLSPANTNREPSTFGLGRDIDIVRAHGGLIDMARDANSVTFRISLPAMSHAKAKVRAAVITEGSGCVLIADDEGPVRRAAVQILLRKGYDVMEASDGEEAVRIFAENVDSIDLVFLDMTMPGLSGLDALKQMQKIRPLTKALVASGYPLDIPTSHFLAKPYSPLDLVRRIQEVLNEETQSA